MTFKFNIYFLVTFQKLFFNHRVYIDDEAEDEITGSQYNSFFLLLVHCVDGLLVFLLAQR